MRTATKAAIGLAGIAGAAILSEQLAVRRLRKRVDPATDPLFTLPEDILHHYVTTTDGAELHLVERGTGRPLLLLHGVTLAASIWAPQLRDLAGTRDKPGFRVIALDLRGHAQSTVGSDGWGIPVLARDLATVLEELDLRDAIVAGHSMGGMTLMQFCADHPVVLRDRVAAVAFIATAAYAPIHPRATDRVKVLTARAVDRLDSGASVPEVKLGDDISLLMCRLAFGKNPSAAAVEQVRACVEAMDTESLQRHWLGILDHDVRDSLPKLDVPAEIVVGSRDLLTPVSSARAIARLLPHAEFHLLPEAGHQLMQERPAELDRILRHLSERTEATEASHA